MSVYNYIAFHLLCFARLRFDQLNDEYSVSCKVLFRSSHQSFSIRKGVLRNFAKFTGKHL